MSAVWFKSCLNENVEASEKRLYKRGSIILAGWWSPTNSGLNTKHRGVSLITLNGIHPGIWVPSELRYAVVDFFPPFSLWKPRVARCIQTLGWPMSTHAPWLESLCFPGYHLGFRKHSFMVAGLLPAGPIVINQSTSNAAHCVFCRPTVLGQQVG